MTYFGHSISNPFRSQVPRGFYHPIKGHTGIDIIMPEGTPLSLPLALKILSIKNQTEMGLTLYAQDPNSNVLVFSHLSKVTVAEGSSITPSTLLAYSGNSGSATTAPHLHFEIIAKAPQPNLEVMTRSLGEFSGYNIDPKPYLDSLLAPHWADGAMTWALEHEIITQKHDPDSSLTWGEYAVTLQRLAQKIMEWTGKS